MCDNTATENWTNMTPRKNNKMRTCLPSETSGKAVVADGGNCALEPLPVSCLWNTMILIGTCVQPPGIFQDGRMLGTSSCSVARLIGLNWADCGAETSWMVFRTDVEHGENKTWEAIEPVLPAAAGAARLWHPKLGTPALRNRGLLPGVFGSPLPADIAASNSPGLQELRSVCAWGWILASSRACTKNSIRIWINNITYRMVLKHPQNPWRKSHQKQLIQAVW